MAAPSSRRGILLLGFLGLAIAAGVIGVRSRHAAPADPPVPVVPQTRIPAEAAPAAVTPPPASRITTAAKQPSLPRYTKKIIDLDGRLRESNGSVRYTSGRFGVLVEKGAMRFTAKDATRTSAPSTVKFTLEDVRVDGIVLSGGHEAQARTRPDGKTVYYDRGPVEEQYVLGPDGCEQNFLIRSLPPERGEVVVRGRVETNTTPPPDGSKGGSLTFRRGDQEAFSISKAIAIDAKGKRLPLELEYADGRLSMAVPADWMRSAELPVLIDPYFASHLNLVPIPNYYFEGPVCAANPSDGTVLVVWSQWDGGEWPDFDILVQRFEGGNPSGSPITIVDTPGYKIVGALGSSGVPALRSLLIWREETSGGASSLRGMFLDSTAGFPLDPSFQLAASATSSVGRITSLAYGQLGWYLVGSGEASGYFLDNSGTVIGVLRPDQDGPSGTRFAVASLGTDFAVAYANTSELYVRKIVSHTSATSPVKQADISSGSMVLLSAGSAGTNSYVLAWDNNLREYDASLLPLTARTKLGLPDPLDSLWSVVSPASEGWYVVGSGTYFRTTETGGFTIGVPFGARLSGRLDRRYAGDLLFFEDVSDPNEMAYIPQQAAAAASHNVAVVTYLEQGQAPVNYQNRLTAWSVYFEPTAEAPVLSALSFPDRVDLSWTAVPGASGYHVYRQQNIAESPHSEKFWTTGTSFSDMPQNNDAQIYWVQAKMSSGVSPLSNSQFGAYVSAGLATPSDLTAIPFSEQVSLSWTAVPGAAGYRILRASSAQGPYSALASHVGTTTYADTGLLNGSVYYYRVRAYAAMAESADAEVSARAGGLPDAPTGLTATPRPERIDLQWGPTSGALSYTVKRSATSGGPYTALASGLTATTYLDDPVAPGTTYYYVVSATNARGEGPDSAEARATTPVPPAAPTGVAAVLGNGQVTVSWSPVTGADSYTVEFSAGGGPYQVLAENITASSIVHEGLTNGSTYVYIVKAVNAAGDGPYSAPVQAVPQAVPPVPAGLAATARSGQALLTWTASGGATSYVVARSATAGGPYADVATVCATSYLDAPLANGAIHYYVVRAVNAAGASLPSAEVSAAPVAPPAPPGNVAATPRNGAVSLTWNVSGSATSYVVRRATSAGGPYATVGTGIVTTSFVDVGARNGTTYYYTVTAHNAGGASAPSGAVSATPMAVPEAPTGLVATPGNAQATLTWTAVSGASSYSVRRATSATGSYTTVITGLTSPGYTNTGLDNGRHYYYVVTASNFSGESYYSQQVHVQPFGVPDAPTQSPLESFNQALKVSWGSVATPAGAPSHWFTVKRATAVGGPYTTVATNLPSSQREYWDYAVVNGTVYYYVVTASTANGEGPPSSIRSGMPSPSQPLSPPRNVTAVAGNAQVVLTWTAVPGAASYTVRRGTQNVATGWTGLTYTDTGLNNGSSYSYRIRAVSADAESRDSDSVSARPSAPPGAPSSLWSVAGSTSVTLNWNSVQIPNGASFRHYRVKRSLTAGGPFTTVAEGFTNSGYVNGGLTNGTTYHYVVCAYTNVGEGPPSPQTQATPQSHLIPPAPGSLSAVAGDAKVTLTWGASEGATSYTVKRSSRAGGSYTPIASGVSTTSFVDPAAANGDRQYYVVSAVNASGESGNSPEASALPLAIPTGVVAVPGNGQVQVSWMQNSAQSYNVWRSTSSGGPYVLSGNTTATSFLVAGLANATTYFFAVSAVDHGGNESRLSAEASATPIALPSAPADLAANAGYREITLSWTSSALATSYTIRRATRTGGAYSVLATGVVGTSYVDSNLLTNVTYCYVIRAVNAQGESADSAEASAMPIIPPPVITTANGKKTNNRSPRITGTSQPGFTIRVSFNGYWEGAEVPVDAAGAWAFTPVLPYPDGLHLVTAVAYLGSDASKPSAPLTILIDTVCTPPENVTATPRDQSIDVEWSPSVDGDVIGYRIYRSTTGLTGPFELLNTTQLVTGTRYRDSALTNGQRYWYRVTAVDDTLDED